jgi:protein-ribulosamine 3-kinase
MLPDMLLHAVSGTLNQLGDCTGIKKVTPVGGGCINHAVRLESNKRCYFLKWNSNPYAGMFEAEANGLALMAETGSVRVPKVLAVAGIDDRTPSYLLLEWLETGVSLHPSEAQIQLGIKLAMMHHYMPQVSTGQYGLGENNYIGSNPQINDWEQDWITFFREKRLLFQCDLAVKNGLMPHQRQKKLENLMQNLASFMGGVQRRPALIHGDLWGGNVIAAAGELALIDPAVYYGDREAELAFTELFGGFGADFYEGYSQTYPLEPGYKKRKDLYNLYHLLNHLNLFGEGYGSQVDAVLRYYVG